MVALLTISDRECGHKAQYRQNHSNFYKDLFRLYPRLVARSWQTGVNNTNIFGVSTALVLLSAYLYQATSNNTYLRCRSTIWCFYDNIMHITRGEQWDTQQCQ
ncbi:hypothetical protein BT96DRAFT_168453 [Gymnopus androsaceus JB14]|uniref:Uncharacterized protein n=1 Tax=Gymnopus androsaceus JB14 TaxID=1447944 RepID=A0A6A4GBF8_9AGAR|nr:hypothetical protein BT96DRAFT_168453 [Gymnopus androsaceus JB14]